ncbi:MAG TPA: ABC transporter substrate-binding protein [Bacteroidia bacterium]|jgi:oligopeptide transport system substrate-binding protein|nr:ABC transporter substrate-binding protein [Bacteroidia bacterium]
MHYKKIIAITALFFLLMLSLFSCGGKKNENSDKKIFHYNELAGISSLDPAASRTFENIWAVNQLFNGLVQTDDKLSIEPCIAKSWEISEDGKIYTFHLRNDVFFHDHKLFKDGKGRKVTAADFVFSFSRLFDPKVSSALSLLDNIDRIQKGGFESTNDSTFVIYLRENFSPFLGILTMKYFSVVPQEIVTNYKEDFRKNPVGTGPFSFKMWEEGTQLTMVKNPTYFERDANNNPLPYLDAVSISFIKDKETSFMQFMKGDLDMISGMDAFNPSEVLDDKGKLKPFYKKKFVLQAQPYLKTDYLGFLIDDKEAAVKNSPTTNRAVRRAINYAIDREKIIKYFHKNLGIPATAGFIPAALPSYNPNNVKGFNYNPDKARELLLEAGYPGGKNLPEIHLFSTETYTDMFEFIQSELAESGIKIKIMVEKPSVLTQAIANNEIPFFRKSWIGDYPDEENFMSLFYSKNFSPKGFNYTHYSNPIFDKCYEQARNCLNDSIRISLYQKMDQMLIDDAPIVPLYYDEVVRLVSQKISGLSANPTNLLNLKQVKKN